MEGRPSSDGSYGNASVKSHEHGEWEVASGGQEKVPRPC